MQTNKTPYLSALRLAFTIAIISVFVSTGAAQSVTRGPYLLQRSKLVLDRFLSQQPNHFEGLTTRARVLLSMRLWSRSNHFLPRVVKAKP